MIVEYDRFADFLIKEKTKTFKIKFSEIEKICKGKLPDSAYHYPAWWSNSDTHPLMKVILNKSWTSSECDLKNKMIRFNKNAKGKSQIKNTSTRKKIHRSKKIIFDLSKTLKSGIIENDYDLISNNKKTLFQDLINQFVKEISLKKIEIYNEASIQHELAIFLRSHLSNYKIQFERNISVFGLDKKRFMKKEIDLVIFNTDNHDIYAIEIKFPNNGAYPNQMLIICEDLKFLEELKQSNFTKCFCLVFANDDNFWNSKGSGNALTQKIQHNQ